VEKPLETVRELVPLNCRHAHSISGRKERQNILQSRYWKGRQGREKISTTQSAIPQWLWWLWWL